jgi:cell division protein FtsN
MTLNKLLDLAFFCVVALVLALIGYVWTRGPLLHRTVVLSSAPTPPGAAGRRVHPTSPPAADRAPFPSEHGAPLRRGPAGPSGAGRAPTPTTAPDSTQPAKHHIAPVRSAQPDQQVFARSEHETGHPAGQPGSRATPRSSPRHEQNSNPPDHSAQPVEPESLQQRAATGPQRQGTPPAFARSAEHPGAESAAAAVAGETWASADANLRYHVQVGAFRSREYANDLLRQLRAHGFTGTLVKDNLYRVWVGGARSRADAEQLARRLEDAGFQTLLTPAQGGLRHTSGQPAARGRPPVTSRYPAASFL